MQLFVARIFRGGGDADAEGLDLGIGLVLTLLAMPGGFVSLFLLNKYGTFLQWLRGITNVDRSAGCASRRILLHRAFHDGDRRGRRLAMGRHLPRSPRLHESGSAADRDARRFSSPISSRCFFWWAGRGRRQRGVVHSVPHGRGGGDTAKFLFFVKFAAIHALGVLLSSVFSFFAVFSVLGLLMAVLPPSAFRRVSAYARGVVVVYLVALLCTTVAVPDSCGRQKDPLRGWTFLMPSCWFLGLCQSLRGRAGPAMVELAKLALPGVGAVVLVALCAYVVGYRRHFVRIAELTETTLDAAQCTRHRDRDTLLASPRLLAHSIPDRRLSLSFGRLCSAAKPTAWF